MGGGFGGEDLPAGEDEGVDCVSQFAGELQEGGVWLLDVGEGGAVVLSARDGSSGCRDVRHGELLV